ncbi:MAG TPA: (2Fe-2S)-binding protein [Thermomicrobiales bacterium]|nr:(2Fe-2S)-binding protein [Thermomicrobiales bacterium]
MVPTRLPSDSDGAPVSFTFDDQSLVAQPGDTIASALYANGITIFGEHPTTGEAYGGFCLVGRCGDCLVGVDGQPGVMACRTEIRAGMSVSSQHGRGEWGNAV